MLQSYAPKVFIFFMMITISILAEEVSPVKSTDPRPSPIAPTTPTQPKEEEVKVVVQEKKDASPPKLFKIEDVNPYQADESTGTKTSTPLRDIPGSVQVITHKLIEDQGATSLDQVIHNVSSVTQSSSSNYGFFNNYQSRGLAVSFLRDGIPDGPNVNGYARSLTNVERVEVYKGPGSALFGSLQPGGTINLVTKAPENNARYELSETVASYDSYKEQMDVGGPLIKDKLKARLNVGKTDVNGYRGVGQKTVEIMPSLEWKPQQDNSLRVDFDYRHLQVDSDSYGIPFKGLHILDENHSTDDRFDTQFSNADQEIYRGGLKDIWKINSFLTLNNNFVLLRRETDILRNSGGAIATPTSIAQTARALRKQYDETYDMLYQFEPVLNFKTGFVKHQMLLGYEYQRKDWQSRRWQANLGDITNIYDPLVPDKTNQFRSYVLQNERHWDADFHALYAQDQITLTDKVKLRLGVRQDRFDIETYDTVLPVSPANGNNEDAHTDHPISVNAGLVYQPWKVQSFYMGYGTSHNALISTESTTLGKPESGLQYEVGSKTALWNGRVTMDVAFYHTVRKDFLVTVNGDPEPVGQQRTRGMDIDFSATPIKGWNLRANYAFQDATLVKVPQNIGLPSVDGNRPTAVPVDSASFFSNYEIQSGIAKGLGFNLGATWKEETWFDMQNTRRIPGFTTFDTGLSYHYRFMKAQFGVKNFTDEKYYTNGVNSGARPGDPRTFWGSINFRF